MAQTAFEIKNYKKEVPNVKGYKGFSKGFVCRGKKYAENTVVEEKSDTICKSGMHFCKNPFDVLCYYGLVNNDGTFNDFAEVEALGEVATDDNKKFCTTKLRVGEKLSFAGFIKACIDFVIEKTVKGEPGEDDSSWNNAQIGSSCDDAQIGSSWYYAKIGSSGDDAKISCAGNDSVICCAGAGSIVKARRGCWITLAEREYDYQNGRHIPVCVKTEFVDGDRIKEDVFYRLEKGEFVVTE